MEQNLGEISNMKCTRANYIPHRTPYHIPSREKWHRHYHNDLVSLYNIVANIMTDRYESKSKSENKTKVKIRWESNKIFNDFSILIYETSSKYID